MPEVHTALLIPAEDLLNVRCVDTTDTAEALSKLIGATWCDVIRTRYPDAQLVVDDEGLLTGRPYNERASAATRGRQIVGDALVLGLIGPDTTDVPQYIVDEIGDH